jgi:hypothetical protein
MKRENIFTATEARLSSNADSARPQQRRRHSFVWIFATRVALVRI